MTIIKSKILIFFKARSFYNTKKIIFILEQSNVLKIDCITSTLGANLLKPIWSIFGKLDHFGMVKIFSITMKGPDLTKLLIKFTRKFI